MIQRHRAVPLRQYLAAYLTLWAGCKYSPHTSPNVFLIEEADEPDCEENENIAREENLKSSLEKGKGMYMIVCLEGVGPRGIGWRGGCAAGRKSSGAEAMQKKSGEA